MKHRVEGGLGIRDGLLAVIVVGRPVREVELHHQDVLALEPRVLVPEGGGDFGVLGHWPLGARGGLGPPELGPRCMPAPLAVAQPLQ